LLDRGMDQHGQQDNRAQRNDPLHRIELLGHDLAA
jgi:hypothetical protein